MIEQGEKQEAGFNLANSKVSILPVVAFTVAVGAISMLVTHVRAMELQTDVWLFLCALLRRKARKMMVWKVRTLVVPASLVLPVEVDELELSTAVSQRRARIADQTPSTLCGRS